MKARIFQCPTSRKALIVVIAMTHRKNNLGIKVIRVLAERHKAHLLSTRKMTYACAEY